MLYVLILCASFFNATEPYGASMGCVTVPMDTQYRCIAEKIRLSGAKSKPPFNYGMCVKVRD